MILLVFFLSAFAVVHMVPAIPRAKAVAQRNLGRAYGPLYGVASLLLLVSCVIFFRRAEPGFVYDPPAWGRHANFLLTLVAFLFVGIFLARGSWRNRVKYPMAIATGFWSVGHLLANGDARSVMFFAMLGCTAFVHAFLASRIYDRRLGEERGGHNLLSILFGLALYGLMAQLHGTLIGVPVIDLAGMAP
jgi:uncharacterized membrane protein